MKDAQKIMPSTGRLLRWVLALTMVLSGIAITPAPAAAQHGPAYAPTHKPRVWRYRHNVWRGPTQGRRWRSRPRYRRVPRRPMYRPPRPAYRVGPGRVWVPAPPRVYRGRVYVAPPRVYVVPPQPHRGGEILPNGGHVAPPGQPPQVNEGAAPPEVDETPDESSGQANGQPAPPEEATGVRPPPPSERPGVSAPDGLPADLDPSLPPQRGQDVPAPETALPTPSPSSVSRPAPSPAPKAPKESVSPSDNAVPLPPPDVRGTLGDAETAAIGAEVLRLINIERVKAKLPRLTNHVRLSTAAWLHSREMYSKRYFSHESPQKRSRKFTDRIRNAGVVKHGAAGENIAMTHLSKDVARRLVQMWMNSPGHRANILHKSFRFSGLGIYGDGDYVYGTQVFTQKVATPVLGTGGRSKAPAKGGPSQVI